MFKSIESNKALRPIILGAIFLGLLVAFALAGEGGLPTARPAEAVETTTTWTYPTSGGIQVGAGPSSTTIPSIPAPCNNCYITRIVPELVYQNDPDPINHPDGTSANFNNDGAHNIWLHHMVVIDACNLGNRIVSSGNERTIWQVPAGYGYYYSCGSGTWHLNYHIHNSSSVTRGVAIKLVVTYRTGETLTPVTPVWLDMATMATSSEFTVPEGYSDTHTGSGASGINSDWTSTVQGQIVSIGGHVHDYGISVAAYNNRLGDYICTSIGGYGTGSRYLPTGGPGTPGHPAAGNARVLNQAYHEAGGSPDDRHHIQEMTSCSPTPVQSIICIGDVIRLHTQYNNTSGFPIFDAMGIIGVEVNATLPDADFDGTIDACDNGDSDADGFTDRVEYFVDTKPPTDCATNSTPNNEDPPDAWPVDFNDSRTVNGADVGKFSPAYGKTIAQGPFGSPPLPGARFDFNVSGVINGADIGKFAAHYGTACA